MKNHQLTELHMIKGPFHRRGLMRSRKAEKKEYSLAMSGQEPSYKGIVDRNDAGVDAYTYDMSPQETLGPSLNM